MIREVTPDLREKILSEYYWQHHRHLSKAVDNELKNFGKALIIDCHSYPSVPLRRDLDKNPNRPDFNIGTDPYHTPKELIDLSVSFFKEAGYTLGIDWPYKGSIVPLEHYHKNKNVQTIMLEINRGLYLNEPCNEKSESYLKVKEITQLFIKTIKSSL
ncbi:MAG: N-formylglutamate amidohydrolase [Saprospirales bacterium]|nr:MAG: N-formylglutamate amidohydrolase [Saprospirales bacterium]